MLGARRSRSALMERYGLTLVVLTLGGQGARGYFRGRRLAVPGRRAHCADATGAGDAFWGGMLSQMRFRGVTQAEQLTGLSRWCRRRWSTATSADGSVFRAEGRSPPCPPGRRSSGIWCKCGIFTENREKFIDKKKTGFFNKTCKGASARRLR